MKLGPADVEIMVQNALEAIVTRVDAQAASPHSAFTLAFLAEVHKRVALVFEARAVIAYDAEEAAERSKHS